MVGTIAMVLAGSCSPNKVNGPIAPDIPPNTVTMAGMMFYPTTLTVSKGTTVTWQNNDAITHTSTSDAPGIWDTGDIASNSSKTVTFNTVGTFRYHCKYHEGMGMVGIIVVK